MNKIYKFKVGDVVKCVSGNNGIEMGKIYRVTRVYGRNVNLLHLEGVNDKCGAPIKYFDWRFKLAMQNEINQMNNKKYSVEQGFAIHTNGNMRLWKLFQEMAFEKGVLWSGDCKNINNWNPQFLDISINTRFGKCLMHSCSEDCFIKEVTVFDAIKDFEKIVEAFNKIGIIKAPIINGHMAEYKKDDNVVKFGCAEINKFALISLFTSNNTKVGNRKIKSITLDSNVVITIEEIKSILDYIDEVNKN